MKRIGLMTIWSVPNYGSVLQCFATQAVIEKMGYRCEVINYAYPNEWNYRQGLPRPRRNPLRALARAMGLKAQHRKALILDRFRKEHLNLTRRYGSLDALRGADWSGYDAFVSGSDQLWNARYTKGDSAFLLSFVPEGKRRVSIASSFALEALPAQYAGKFREELSKYAALSVRETNGQRLINGQLGIGKDVFVCLDPTLLLSGEEWVRALPLKGGPAEREPYILLYMWTYAFEPRPYIFDVVRRFQAEMRCGVIALEGYTPAGAAGGLRMHCAEDSALPRFIDLFANASLVVTSSFHGTAFAVNFGRPLISVVPDNAGDDRQGSFLRGVGAECCIAQVGQDVGTLNPHYDTEAVARRLTSQRAQCLEWIERNLDC